LVRTCEPGLLEHGTSSGPVSGKAPLNECVTAYVEMKTAPSGRRLFVALVRRKMTGRAPASPGAADKSITVEWVARSPRPVSIRLQRPVQLLRHSERRCLSCRVHSVGGRPFA